MTFPTFHFKRQAHVDLLCSVHVLPIQTSTTCMVVTLFHHLIIILLIFTLCCVKCLYKHKIDFLITHREAQINPYCATYYSEVLQIEFYAVCLATHSQLDFPFRNFTFKYLQGRDTVTAAIFSKSLRLQTS